MKALSLHSLVLGSVSICLAGAVACGGGTDAADLNKDYVPKAGASSTGGAPSTAGSNSGAGSPAMVGGTGNSGGTGTTGGAPMGGSGNVAGSGEMAGSGGSGTGGAPDTGPYADRTGSFKMLVYSETLGFHHDSIPAGQQMLKDIGQEQGFEVTIAENDSGISADGLAPYEIVFFMNSTGEIFNDGGKRQIYEDWLKKNGAYGGTHSATDTAAGWEFYKEPSGQYYDSHQACCAEADITWTADGDKHFVSQGLPRPWHRAEEWYKFNSYQSWSGKPGFTILSLVSTGDGGTRPVSYVREWGNFRAFYTSLGHQSVAFQDPLVKQHVARGIMWAVRREKLFKP